MLLTAFASWLGQSGLEFAANYRNSSQAVREAIQADIQSFGLDLPHFLIENISLPPEVEQALDRRASMNVLGNLQSYTQYQVANAIETSAQTSGSSNPAMELGFGVAMGQQIVNAMQPHASAHVPPPAAPPGLVTSPAAAPPPPLPVPAAEWFITREGQNFGPYALNQLLANGLTPQSNVWRSGLSGWQPAANVPELAGLFQVPPPPAQ
jgi:hypothetical protein